MAQFLASAHPYRRVVYLSRHGGREYNVQKKLGGDSNLSPLGREYAPRLAEFAELVICGGAQEFEYVTIHADEVPSLRDHLCSVPPSGETGGLFAIQGSSGRSSVRSGMKLMRWQLGYGNPFQEPPQSLNEVMRQASA